MKSEIIERLGQADLLLPALIAEGLTANDRVKLRLSVLQAAARHAGEPTGARFDLARECHAAGIDHIALETLVNRAVMSAGEQISAPGLGALGAAIWEDVVAMIRAVKAGDTADGTKAEERLAALQRLAPVGTSDIVEFRDVMRLTAISDADGDSLHRLVMDLHKALNRHAAAHAEETLAGARVSGLLPEDRPAAEAFMRGVHATEKLKFGHPGLATTATRSGERLTIQNDIGETDAHVVVIAVEHDAVTVTYTDVHLARAKFFIGLFRNFAVEWSGLERKSAAGLGDDGAFYLVTGRFIYENAESRDAFLESVGASLVFLIDWNKARKVLRGWISKNDAIRVLSWAAHHRIGHRAFLELGGGDLVAAAVHHATPTRIGFGERLDNVLGRDAAVDFVKTVLRVSAEALAEGGSTRLARDRIEAALVAHLQRVDRTLMAVMIRQASRATSRPRPPASSPSAKPVGHSTQRRWRIAHGASRKKPIGSPSMRAAPSHASMPTAASNGWSIRWRTRSTSLNRPPSSPRSFRARFLRNCSNRLRNSVRQRFPAQKRRRPVLRQRRTFRKAIASTPKMRSPPSGD
jgi:hypothetical protein